MPKLDVSRERLLALVAQQAESASLEFIADCDLTERRDVVELASEVGAMAAHAGSIVVGVDDRGSTAARFDEKKAALFDEATLRDKLARYLPASVEFRVGQHQLEDRPIVLIEVSQHPDGAVVFTGDGTFDRSGKPQTAFRRGELYVRHGTKSERPSQDDIQRIGHEPSRVPRRRF